MSNQLTPADCHYIQEALNLRRVGITYVLVEGPLTASEESQVAYIDALIERLSVLEDQLETGYGLTAQLRDEGPPELAPPAWFSHNEAHAWSCGRAVGWNDALDSVVEVG